ncbi:MAG: PilZ domain-containing protein [Candidatus Auribacterota bacterium]
MNDIPNKEFKGQEKRKYTRIPFNYVVTCRDFSGNVESVSHFAFMHSKNISAGGLLLESKYYYPPSSLLEIKLSVPSMLHSIKVVGEVIRSEEIKENHVYTLGISFVRIDNKDRNALIAFIEDHISAEEK